MTKIVALCVAAVLVGIDQLIKFWAYEFLRPQRSMQAIPHVLNFTYVENRGAAFGIFQNRTIMLSVIVLVFLTVIFIFLLSNKVKKEDKFLIWILSLILAGGAGNLVDRFARGFVVDYLDITPLFTFPVFNFADCCVVVGAVLMVIYVIVGEKKERQNKTTAFEGKE